MIGVEDTGDLKIGYLEIRTMEDEIELPFRITTGMGWLSFPVGIDQAGGAEEQVQLFITPEHIEITGNNDRSRNPANEPVQTFELVLAIAVGQGKMDQKNGEPRNPDLNNQPFDALFKIVEPVLDNGKPGKNGIALPVEQGHPAGHGTGAVFGLHNMIMAKPTGDLFGLAETAGPKRTGVHLDQADNIRVDLLKKTDNLVKNPG